MTWELPLGELTFHVQLETGHSAVTTAIVFPDPPHMTMKPYLVVSASGSNPVLDPTETRYRAVMEFLQRVYPTPLDWLEIAFGLPGELHLTSKTYGNDTGNWNDLSKFLNDDFDNRLQQVQSNCVRVGYGMMTRSVLTGNIVGIEYPGRHVAIGQNLATHHEVGHLLGMMHTTCNGDEGNPDPDFVPRGRFIPVGTQPLGVGNIAEVGIDVVGAFRALFQQGDAPFLHIKKPSFGDFMGNGGFPCSKRDFAPDPGNANFVEVDMGRWVSPYRYLLLFERTQHLCYVQGGGGF